MKKLDLVLIIDDDATDNEFHEMVIKQAGITTDVKSITEGKKALEYLKKSCNPRNKGEFPIPNLIFLDINMPGMTGFELLDEFRKLCPPKNMKEQMKFFMLTGSLNPDDYNLATEKYGDILVGFRIKPLTVAVFQEIVKKHFDKQYWKAAAINAE